MKSLKEKLGARIQELRKHKKLTQECLAEMVGIDTPNLSNIERGKRFVSSDTLEKIVTALGVKESELFDFGHFNDRDELIGLINDILEKSEDKDIRYYYRMMNIYSDSK